MSYFKGNNAAPPPTLRRTIQPRPVSRLNTQLELGVDDTGTVTAGIITVVGGTVTATAGQEATGSVTAGIVTVVGSSVTGDAGQADTGDVTAGIIAVVGGSVTGLDGGAMAITFRSTTTDALTGTVVNPGLPAGTADGDILICHLSNTTGCNWSEPGGWTAAHTEVDSGSATTMTYYRVISNAAGEPATYAFTASVSAPIRAIIDCYSGVDTTTPMDAAATTSNNASSTVIKAVSITTVTANAMLVWGGHVDSSTFTVTKPASTTLAYQGAALVRSTTAYELQATAGASGDKDGSVGTARASIGILIALRPAGAAATSLPPFRRWFRTLIRM